MWILIIILLLLILLLRKKIENFKVEGEVYYDKCIEICNDNTFCLNYESEKRSYNECVQCHKKNHCFKKFENNQYVCEPCVKGVKYVNNCNDTYFDACPPKNNK